MIPLSSAAARPCAIWITPIDSGSYKPDGAVRDPVTERLAVQQLGDDERGSSCSPTSKNGQDVWMRQRRDGLRFVSRTETRLQDPPRASRQP